MARSRKRKKKGKTVSGSRPGQSGNSNPLNLIKKKGRSLPVYRSYINEGAEDINQMTILTCVKEMGSKYLVGVYLIDRGCLGLKNTVVHILESWDSVEDFLEKAYPMGMDHLDCEWDMLNELVYKGIDFAGQYGFKPNKDFKITQYLLKEESEVGDEFDIDFGDNDMPIYFAGPYDDVKRVIGKLNRTAGPGNYVFVTADGERFNGLDEDGEVLSEADWKAQLDLEYYKIKDAMEEHRQEMIEELDEEEQERVRNIDESEVVSTIEFEEDEESSDTVSYIEFDDVEYNKDNQDNGPSI